MHGVSAPLLLLTILLYYYYYQYYCSTTTVAAAVLLCPTTAVLTAVLRLLYYYSLYYYSPTTPLRPARVLNCTTALPGAVDSAVLQNESAGLYAPTRLLRWSYAEPGTGCSGTVRAGAFRALHVATMAGAAAPLCAVLIRAVRLYAQGSDLAYMAAYLDASLAIRENATFEQQVTFTFTVRRAPEPKADALSRKEVRNVQANVLWTLDNALGALG